VSPAEDRTPGYRIDNSFDAELLADVGIEVHSLCDRRSDRINVCSENRIGLCDTKHLNQGSDKSTSESKNRHLPITQFRKSEGAVKADNEKTKCGN
jgi:hypothetical protein